MAAQVEPNNAPHARARRTLVHSIQSAVLKRGITQGAAAKQCGFARPRFNRLMRPEESKKFSLDALIDIASCMGIKVVLQVVEEEAADDTQGELAL